MGKVVCYPGAKGYTHEVSLGVKGEVFGLLLEGGAKGVDETMQEPDNLLVNKQGGKFGDWEPGMSHIEQRSWHNGRGQEWLNDKSRFYDSRNAWTVTPEVLLPGPAWNFPTGLRSSDKHLNHNTVWEKLYDDQRGISVSFAASASYNLKRAYLWIRRRGTPGTGTLELCSDSGGNPGTVLKTWTFTALDITDILAEFWRFVAASAQAVTSATTYHLKVYGAATDGEASHWEVGVDNSVSASKVSSDLSSWSAAAFKLQFRVVDDKAARTWNAAHLGTAMFAFDQKDSGSTTTGYVWDEANDEWDLLTAGAGALPTGSVLDLCVSNSMIYLAQGDSVNIVKMRNNGGSYEFDVDGTNKATRLHAFADPVSGPVVWRAFSTNQISYAPAVTWSTDLTFQTAKSVGDTTFGIIELWDYNNALWVRKGDSLWYVAAGVPISLNVGLWAAFETATRTPMISKDLFLYFAWSFSVERMYGGTLDDIGPWQDAGLPSGQAGPVVSMVPSLGFIFEAIDAGESGRSSVMMYDNTGRHCIFQAPKGDRVRFVYWQPVSGAAPRLWIGCGEDLIFLTFPRDGLHPVQDSAHEYHHEASVEMSAIDMEASALPKFFKALSLTARGLGGAVTVGFDYQLDDDIGSADWTYVEDFRASPRDELKIERGEKHTIRIRLRSMTTQATAAAKISAYVLKGYAKVPDKRQWVFKVKASSVQRTRRGTSDVNPSQLYKMLFSANQLASGIYMRSIWEEMDSIWVIVRPSGLVRRFVNTLQKWWGGTFTVVVREA